MLALHLSEMLMMGEGTKTHARKPLKNTCRCFPSVEAKAVPGHRPAAIANGPRHLGIQQEHRGAALGLHAAMALACPVLAAEARGSAASSKPHPAQPVIYAMFLRRVHMQLIAISSCCRLPCLRSIALTLLIANLYLDLL